MAREYIVYCDESIENGEFYSNFYGGLLITSQKLQSIIDDLETKKAGLNFKGELKWQKVTGNYLSKYIEFMDLLFDYIAAGDIKIRIMFTQNRNAAHHHGEYQKEHKYFLLYYQFIKHAFGLKYIDEGEQAYTKLRFYFDKLPDTREKSELFKDQIMGLSRLKMFRCAKVTFDREQIAEIDSSKHILLQGLDIVLGAMQFRLNDVHLKKPEGARCRGKRTIAKEKLYKHINSRIRELYPNFNIGVSTSDRGEPANRLVDPYRHWLFVPAGSIEDNRLAKTKKPRIR